jgi:glutathione S-transferase
MKPYGMREPGNCWKAATILDLTGHPFAWVQTDSNAGEVQTPAFRGAEPCREGPKLVLDDGTIPIESHAILPHFAEGTAWPPASGLFRTRVHQWLFFEHSLHPLAAAG